MTIEGEFLRLLDEEIERAKEGLLWEYQLDFNEYVFGSAYGPWRTSRTSPGLVSLLSTVGEDVEDLIEHTA